MIKRGLTEPLILNQGHPKASDRRISGIVHPTSVFYAVALGMWAATIIFSIMFRRLKLIAVGVALLLPAYGYGEGVTRNRLLQLFYQANSAMRADDMERSARLFGEIIEAVPQLPEPYESLARMYDFHRNESRENLEAAIFFYRKYIDIQLDDMLTVEATRRLRELEEEIGADHYDEKLAADQVTTEREYQDFNREVEAEMKADRIADEPTVQISENAQTKPESNISQDEESSLKAADIADKGVIAGGGVERGGLELPVPLAIEPERVRSRVMTGMDIAPENLVGRWVSFSRLGNNREVWILDIEYVHDEIRITLNNNSGILSVPQWRQGGLFERESLLAIANAGNVITKEADITSETMQMFSNMKSNVASGIIDNQGRLVFSYNIDLNYVPSAGKYDGTRALISGLGSVFSGMGGVFGTIGQIGSSIANQAVDNAEASDTQLHYSGEINFLLRMTPAGLVGSGRELVVEESDQGEHEKKNRVFSTSFFRVPKYYQGFAVEDADRKKSEQTLRDEKLVLASVREKAKGDPEHQYLLGLLYGYMVGENKTDTERLKNLSAMTTSMSNNKMLKQMTKAAKNGSINAINYLIRHGYDVAASLDSKKSDRKKGLEVAEEWKDKIKFTSPAIAVAGEAEYLIKSKSNYDKALELYLSAERTDNPEVLNRIGELYQFNFDNVASAIDYYIRAAKAGSATAMLNIARLYRDGVGVDEDAEEYLKWTAEAYRSGSLGACDELAFAYTYGIGVSPDIKKANRYIELLGSRQMDYWKEVAERFR